MVNVQGSGRRNVRNLATTTFSTSAVVAITLVAFLGLCLSLAECSPSGARAVDGGAATNNGLISNNDGNELTEAMYQTRNLSPLALSKKMKFIVHRRGVPLIIHKRIPYIVHRKRMDIGGDGFHGDTFSSGFGDFSTSRRKRLMEGSDFYGGDTFSQGFGDFSPQRKRFDTSFNGDTFSGGFGEFSTV